MMKRKSVLIVYERKSREFENCCLLKIVLEKSGFDCDIAQFYDYRYFKLVGTSKYQFIFVPHLYNTKEVDRTLGRFGNKAIIINLQYEQVLSDKWENLGHHTPSGSAMQAHHISWGPATTKRLVDAGISPSFVHTLGALQTDLLRKEFRMGEEIKSNLAKMFNILKGDHWVLFLSSFTYADIDDDRLRMNENVAGTKLSSFVEIHTTSRDKILEWFDVVLRKFPEKEFIYRPHPDELALEKVCELEGRYKNFRVINHASAKFWIEACDQILSWYSTTVVESHFLEKSYSILRPTPLPDDFDSVLLKKGTFVKTVGELMDCLSKGVVHANYALKDEDVIEYYADSDTPVFNKIVVLLNELSSGSTMNYATFFALLPHRIKSFVLLLFVPFVTSENGILKRIINKINLTLGWRKEFKSQAYSSRELELFRNEIVRRIDEK